MNNRRLSPQPKSGRFTRSPGFVNNTCSIMSRMWSFSPAVAVRPRPSIANEKSRYWLSMVVSSDQGTIDLDINVYVDHIVRGVLDDHCSCVVLQVTHDALGDGHKQPAPVAYLPRVGIDLKGLHSWFLTAQQVMEGSVHSICLL